MKDLTNARDDVTAKGELGNHHDDGGFVSEHGRCTRVVELPRGTRAAGEGAARVAGGLQSGAADAGRRVRSIMVSAADRRGSCEDPRHRRYSGTETRPLLAGSSCAHRQIIDTPDGV